MTSSLRLAALAAALVLAPAAGPARSASDYDLLIRNGRVLDGTGNPWVSADIAIQGDRIVRVGRVVGTAAREIDASGLYVSPGWIDMLDASSSVLLENGLAESKVRQGVTTLVSGELGTPVPAGEIHDYFRQLEARGISLNFATYYSATQARVEVMGAAEGNPTPAQLAEIQARARTAMEAGVLGLTTALVYPPGSFQTTEELTEIVSAADGCQAIYATHLRDEGAGLLDAISEAIEIGERSGTKVEIFHLKAAYAPMWRTLMPKAIRLIEEARGRGVDVAANVYPYVAAGTGLNITIPNWAYADGPQEAMRLLRDPKVRERLKRDVAAGSQPGWSNFVEASGGWEGVVLANAFDQQYNEHRFRSIAAIADELGRDPADVAWDIVLAAMPRRASALYFMMDELDLQAALVRPWVSIGSDAPAALVFGDLESIGLPHPRAYGTFPRVIAEYVKRRQVLTLEEAVRKMTSWPAQRLGLGSRGLLREGQVADITIFDFDTLEDRATWSAPTEPPVGIDYVIVGGDIVLDSGVHSGARPGRVLKGACALAEGS